MKKGADVNFGWHMLTLHEYAEETLMVIANLWHIKKGEEKWDDRKATR